jgi:hypothetical protein
MNVRIQYPLTFNAGYWQNGQLSMLTYYVQLSMITNTADSEGQSIAFERLKFFVYNEIDSTIFINRENEEQSIQLALCGLNVTTLPGAPVEQLVGLMLYYKLNAIMEDRIIITEVKINSSASDNVTYIHSENEIPDIELDDWWTSCDLVHCDLDLIDSEEVVTLHQVGAWRELDLGWPADVNDTSDNTVVFADFGKDDKR